MLVREFQSMNIKYKTIDVRTEKGLKMVERLVSNGWTVGSKGKTTAELYKSMSNPSDYKFPIGK